MDTLKKIVIFLLFTTVSGGQRNSKVLMLDSQDKHCHNRQCPTWFICNSYNACECGNDHNLAIACDSKTMTSAVLDCHCVTYDNHRTSTFLGSCFYNCENHKHDDKVYKELPANPKELIKKSVCTRFHRTGSLCGDCEEGYSPYVLSYNLSCVKCPDGHKNWWKFILAGFVPLTLFYLFVLLFNINVTSSRLHGVVWFSQALSVPALVRLIMIGISLRHQQYLTAAKVMLTFYGLWNLDLLRSVIPDICLNVTTLQALALDYLVAFYPFTVILLSYFLMQLYDRKIGLIVTIWKPFRALLTTFRKSWDVRTSIIDSLATFFLLSYIKILSVTSDLLIPTQIYQLGSNISTFGLYYSSTVVYFGKDHLLYGILAVIILALFVGIPMITLILYPFQFFQKILSLFPLNWHFLRAFVDSFQGCYKDGTEPGTFDCRWFAVLMLLFRPLLIFTYALTLSMMFFVYAVIILVIFLITMVNIQPFKKAAVRYPSTDLIFLVLLNIVYIAALARGVADTKHGSYYIAMSALTLLSAFVPIFYVIFFISFWLVSKKRWIHLLIKRLRLQ